MRESPDIAVIGLGRFGRFWANHLGKHYSVSGFDLRMDNIDQTENISVTDLESCLTKDIIFLTIPINKIEKFVQQHAALIKTNSVVIDCASVKECVVAWLEQYVPQRVYYASCHPLFGPDSARAGLRDQQIAFMPGHIPYTFYRRIADIFTQDLQLNVLNISASQHDRLMAYNLSLIHHLGRTFHKMEIFKLPLLMAGLEKLNHISGVVMNDSDELFHDFYKYNTYADEVKKSFIDSFNSISPTK